MLKDKLASTAAILDQLRAELTPWGLAYALDAAWGFVARRWKALPGASPAELELWAPVISGQHDIVIEVETDVLAVVSMLAGAGIGPDSGPPGDQSHPAMQALFAYATAAGTAQLVETARTTLERAKAQKAMLPVSLLSLQTRGAGRDLTQLRHTARDDREAASRVETLGADRERADGEIASLQSEVLATGKPDPAHLEHARVETTSLRLRARTAALRSALRALGHAIDEADQGVIAAIANLPSGARLVMTGSHLEAAAEALSGVESVLDHSQPEAINARFDGLPPGDAREYGRSFALADGRKAQLERAEHAFAAVIQAHQLDGALFERAAREVRDAQIRKLIVNVAALLAVGVAAGALAAMAGELAAGVAAGGRSVATAGEAQSALRTARLIGGATNVAVDAGLNAAAQTALQGDQLGSSFAENAATNVAIRLALRPLHAVLRTWGGLDDEAYALWQQQKATGKVALAKTATVSAELVTAAATAYVVHRMATLARGDKPDEQTIAGWAIQGATLALAHLINTRLQASIARLTSASALAGELVVRMQNQRRLARAVGDAGEVDRGVAMRMLVDHQRTLHDEIAFWRKIVDDPAALRTVGIGRAAAMAKLRGAEAQAADTQGQLFKELPLRLAGLEQEVAGGRLWAGDTEQIAEALSSAQAARLHVEVKPPGDATQIARIWRVKLDGESLEIRERARSGRVREAAPGEQVTSASAAAAGRYGAAARALRPAIEQQARTVVDAGGDFATDVVQIGHGFGGVMNQNTQHEAGPASDPHRHLVVYAHDGAMTSRGALPSGQPPGPQTMPGVRTREHTTDQASYTRSQHLGDATEVGRLEMQTSAYQGKVTALERRPAAPGSGNGVPGATSGDPGTAAAGGTRSSASGAGAAGTGAVRAAGAAAGNHAAKDPWTHPERALRLRVENQDGARWIYCNRVDNLGGMGPTNYAPARGIIGEPGAGPGAKQQMFDQMRAAGVLIGGDDPDISQHLHPGQRVLIWGGSPTGAWAGEDAAMHGAHTHVVSESQHVHRNDQTPEKQQTAFEFQQELRQASADGDAERVQRMLEERIKKTHMGAGLARNRQPGAAYGPDARQRGIHVEVGVPTQMRLLPDGKVEVTLGVGQAAAGVGDQPPVRVFDRVVMALGQNPGDPGGAAGLLGPGARLGGDPKRGIQPDPMAQVPPGTIALHMVRDGTGRVVGLENETGDVRLLGAAYASDKLLPWVVPEERAAFSSQVRATASATERTHTGATISKDSTGVTTGIEAQADRLPVARKVFAAREAALPSTISAERLALPAAQPDQWAARLESYLTKLMRGLTGRVRVTLVATGRDGVHTFRVMNGAEDVGAVRVYDSMEVARLEAQLRTQLAAKVPTLEPEMARGTAALADGMAAELTSHAREPGAGFRRGATLSGLVDEWAAMPETTPDERNAKNKAFTDRVEAAVKRVAQTLAELHNQYADRGALMSPAAKQREIDAVHAQLSSPDVVRALGADEVARIRARLAPLQVAFLAAKLPATAELGNVRAEALEFKDYKVDQGATSLAQKRNPDAKIMMFGKLSIEDGGAIRSSIDPSTGRGAGTGVADVEQFLESLRDEPRLADRIGRLEKVFADNYSKVPEAGPSEEMAAQWYREVSGIRDKARRARHRGAARDGSGIDEVD